MLKDNVADLQFLTADAKVKHQSMLKQGATTHHGNSLQDREKFWFPVICDETVLQNAADFMQRRLTCKTRTDHMDPVELTGRLFKSNTPCQIQRRTEEKRCEAFFCMSHHVFKGSAFDKKFVEGKVFAVCL